jgi:hypothetical protein
MVLIIILVVLAAVITAVSIVLGIVDHRRRRRLAAERQGETICHFARSLDYRRLDTKIIRAVYEGLQDRFCLRLPIRASDDLGQTFRIDPEDLEDFIIETADRCGRCMDGYERNPYHAEVSMVSGLINFLCAQPKSRTSQDL